MQLPHGETTMSNIILLAHPTFGVLGILACVWLLTETLNLSPANIGRVRLACNVVLVLIALTWVFGGYWYVVYYPVEKAIILKGPWSFAHNFFMETKEHLFFIPLILAFFLPFAAKSDLLKSKGARNVVAATAALIIITGLAIEGAGAAINMGVKVGLMQPPATIQQAE